MNMSTSTGRCVLVLIDTCTCSNTVTDMQQELNVLMFIQLGREEPAMSMDANGKIIFAKHSEIQQANLKNIAGESNAKFSVPIVN